MLDIKETKKEHNENMKSDTTQKQSQVACTLKWWVEKSKNKTKGKRVKSEQLDKTDLVPFLRQCVFHQEKADDGVLSDIV